MYYYPAGAEIYPDMQAAMLTFSPRCLVSIYPFLTGKRSINLLKFIVGHMEGREMMVDSGIFTLQGDCWGDTPYEIVRPVRKDYLRAHTKKYIELLRAVGYKGSLVEVDCQGLRKVFQPILEECRQMLADEFGQEKIIHVCHKPAGDDLDEMTERFSWLALSMPELKAEFKHQALSDNALSASIRGFLKGNLDSGHKYHFLGATSPLLAALPDTCSCDSSTWSMVVRYGRAFPRTPFAVRFFRRKKLEAPPAVLEEVERRMPELLRVYKDSPQYTGWAIDIPYLKALACALLASIRYFDSLRERLLVEKKDGIRSKKKQRQPQKEPKEKDKSQRRRRAVSQKEKD